MRGETNGLSWLGGKTWKQKTRAERYFCAELFCAIRQDEDGFVKFLNDKAEPCRSEAQLPIKGENWEAAYEACFYRDIGRQEFSQSHAFDLALFSDDAIILIEAKAHQYLSTAQLTVLSGDRNNVAKCTGVDEKMIFLVGLVSSKYSPQRPTKDHFDLMTTWEALASCYADKKDIFNRANDIYQKAA